MKADDTGSDRYPTSTHDTRRSSSSADHLSKFAVRRPIGPSLSSFRRMPRYPGSDFRRRPQGAAGEAQGQ